MDDPRSDEMLSLKKQITDQINKLERIRLAMGGPVGGQLLEERAEQLYQQAQAWGLLSDIIDKSCDPLIAANRLRAEIEKLRANR